MEDFASSNLKCTTKRSGRFCQGHWGLGFTLGVGTFFFFLFGGGVAKGSQKE